jgi:uncharacterized pyridoxamine 5'-phosphate oxidase family protein
MIDIVDFIHKSGMFFLATTDGDQPKIRPFGEFVKIEGKYYMNTNSQKDVFKQMMKNPKVSICAFSKGQWLRIEAEAVRETKPEIIGIMTKGNPFISKTSEDKGSTFECLYLDKAVCTLYCGAKEPEVFNL